jgi:hypothetical protein
MRQPKTTQAGTRPTIAPGTQTTSRQPLPAALRAQLEHIFTHQITAEEAAQALQEIAQSNPSLFEYSRHNVSAAGTLQADHPGRPQLRPRTTYAPDDGQSAPDGVNAGTQAPAATETPTATPTPAPETPTTDAGPASSPISAWTIDEEHRAGLLKRIESAGGIEQAIQRLWTDNADARRQARQARDDANAAQAALKKAKKDAPEGSITLTPEEAAAWETYTQLGRPEDLQTTLDAYSEASAELARLQRLDTIRQSAELAGFNAQILTDLDKANPGLTFAVEEDEEGRPQAMVTEEEGEPQPLREYAANHWRAYLPILTADPAQPSAGAPGQPYPRQRPAGQTPAGQGSDLVRRLLDEHNAAAASGSRLQQASRPDASQPAQSNPLRR